jgi:hypothetical protein
MNRNGYDVIAQRAYAIWEQEGRPQGKELEHWLRAEAESKNGGAAPVKRKAPAKRAPTTARQTASTGARKAPAG